MGGGYIQCGDFCGDDKSSSAISGVFEELPGVLPESECATFAADVLDPLQSQLEETQEYFLITPEVAARMLPVVELLLETYQAKFGDAEVWDVLEPDTNAKWGEGQGWRYYCLIDLTRGLQHSMRSKKTFAFRLTSRFHVQPPNTIFFMLKNYNLLCLTINCRSMSFVLTLPNFLITFGDR